VKIVADVSAVKEITTKLEQGVKDLFNSDTYADYLKTMSRFHKYSTRNTLLIHMQKPDATLVAGFMSWINKFERHVKKGEKSIKILAPVPFTKKEEKEKLDPDTRQPIIDEDGMPVIEYTERQLARFKVTSVYDVSQTDGKPLPSLVQDLTGNVEQYEAFMDALRAVSPLPIVFEPMDEGHDGYCQFGEKIAIREGMSEIQTVCAVIHELTHAKLHDMEALRLMDENAQPKDRRTEEIEAESVSFSVSNYFGIETGANSFGYVLEWSRGRELKELNASLDTIRKTAAEMIDSIEDKFREIAKERNIAFAIGEQQAELAEPTKEAEIQNTPVQETVEFTDRRRAGAVYYNYCNRISDAVKLDEAYANSILNADEQNARTECEAAINRVVIGLFTESQADHAELYGQYADNPDFKGRLEDYVFMRTYLEPKTAQRNAATETLFSEPAVSVKATNVPNAADIPNRENMIKAILAEQKRLDPELNNTHLLENELNMRFTPSNELIEKYYSYFPREQTSPAVLPIISEYARNAEVGDPRRVGSVILMTPVFDDGNYNRSGKKIRVTVEEKAGKYELFSREENDKKVLYFLTASGRIDRTAGYFRDEWDEQARKWVNARPTEAEFDEVLPKIAEQFDLDMADPTKWAKYQHAAVLNRLDECEAHNIPVRKLRDEEDKRRHEEAEIKRQEEKRQKQEKYDNRVDEIAKAIENGAVISVGYDEYAFDGKNPVLDLFKMYGIDLPLRTQGWVNTGLAEISESGYRYYSSKHKGDSSAFSHYLYSLSQAIRETPIEQKRESTMNPDSAAKEAIKTVENNLYDKFAEMFPQFMNGDYSTLRLEAEHAKPLELEWVFGDRISMSHAYELDGNLAYEPMIMFIVNNKDKTMTACSLELSEPPRNDVVYDDKGHADVDMQKNINNLAVQWLDRAEKQGFKAVSATVELDNNGNISKDGLITDKTVQITFDKDGNPIMPKPEKEYDISYGHLGNGLTVWNRLEEKNGDYVTVAHIDPDRSVSFRDADIPDNLKAKIELIARTSDARVSTSQPENHVFYTPPQPYLLEYHDIPVYCVKVYNELKEQVANVLDNGRIEYTVDCYITESARDEIEAFAKNRAEVREAEFLNGDGDAYGVYLFEPKIDDARAVKDNYRLAWFGKLDEGETLDTIRERFSDTTALPYDCIPRENGKPLGVADIISIKKDGEITPWFVDLLAFSNQNDFNKDLQKNVYNLGYGEEDNGVAVWNWNDLQSNGVYKYLAHINQDRETTYLADNLPNSVKSDIESIAQGDWDKMFEIERKMGEHYADITDKSVGKLTELDMSLPDPTIGFSEMNLYGYAGDDMLPMTNGRAVELFDTDHCIYLLYPDNTEAMALDRDEIIFHDGLCGIEREDWERSPVCAAQLAVAANSEGNREADLLYGGENKFGIYQIRDGIDEARNFRFAPMRELEAYGLSVDRANYELVYTGTLDIRDTQINLHKIQGDFQAESAERPADFNSRSVSVSDVIVLQWRGNVTSHFVDSVGFVKLDAFLGEEKDNAPVAETLSQVGTRSNEYNGKSAAELESDAKSGKVISLTDFSKALSAERNNNQRNDVPKSKKPTLMERLEAGKQKAARQGQPDPPKSNERSDRD